MANNDEQPQNGEEIISQIASTLETNSISNALVCFIHEGKLITFYKGEFYTTAKLACDIANKFKQQINKDLNIM